ncbi:DUF1214 domain-containing protein [Pseudomonas sp. URMO17WK12:I7]|uniref:DUF1214 domain-containing protein n=1 Tax=Pseudomonas sp. URMO17WK12:I7 TaxID=1283290 RepID=UPI00210A563B|nr:MULTISPECIES: DUF1214 domain-containing protein [unclassified Pseudomonas]
MNGANGKPYVMHFKAPEVSQFWSFTVYASDNRLMAHNAINRHRRGDRTLKPDDKGEYTLERSAKGDEGNPDYLPIPQKNA